LRVALVCPYDWAKPGGVRAHVDSLAGYLRGAHDVAVFAPASAPVPPDVHRVGRPVGIPFNASVAPLAPAPTAARRLLRELRAYAPEIVHVHEPLVPVVALAAAAAGPRPVVGTFHAWSDRARLYRGVAPLGRRVAARLAARIAVSPAARSYAAAALGLPEGAFALVPNGIDVARFAATEPIPELADRDRPLLLFVGRLERRKGLEVLVRAYLRLRVSRPEVRLCVVGDGPERDRCQRLVPPSVRPDVLFVGAVAPDDLPRYHASADVFVAPALGGESFGIVLLEAMAAGLPVVASAIPGYRTVLRDGLQGRLVAPADVPALADALAVLCANGHLRAALAAQGRITAEEYDWTVVGARVAAVYRQVATTGH
jgi:phosphatidyl-myo-inositol alpha-mannosyltransferase